MEVRRRERLRGLERRGRFLRREDLRLLSVHLRVLWPLHPAVVGLRRRQRLLRQRGRDRLSPHHVLSLAVQVQQLEAGKCSS